jgi:hypothetical protein
VVCEDANLNQVGRCFSFASFTFFGKHCCCIDTRSEWQGYLCGVRGCRPQPGGRLFILSTVS